jgi:hypothetical protein
MECGNPIRKHVPHDKRELRVECYNQHKNNPCPASYTIFNKGNRQVEWQPHLPEIKCGNKDCQDKVVLWQRELELGEYWICPKCHGHNIFSLGIVFKPQGHG